MGTFSETLERSAVVDATTAFHYDHARLLFRQSQPQPNPWTFYILPFQLPVYLVIVVCLLVTFALLLAVRFCRCVGEDEKQEEGSAGGRSGGGGGGGGGGNERKGFDHSLQTDRWTESEGLEESTQQQQQQQQQAATRYAQDSEGSDEVVETRGWLGKPEGGSHDHQDFGPRSQSEEREERTTAQRRNAVSADERRPAGQRDRRQQNQSLDGIALMSEEDRNVPGEDLRDRWEENGEQLEDPQDTAAYGRGKSVTEWLLDNLETLLAGLVNRREFSVIATVGWNGSVAEVVGKLVSLTCEKERENSELRTQNSELYYTRIKNLGSCVFLQSVPANLHASRLHIKQ